MACASDHVRLMPGGFLQQCGEFRSGYGPAEKIALPLGTMMRLQKRQLLPRFNPLGHDPLFKAGPHPDDRTYHGFA